MDLLAWNVSELAVSGMAEQLVLEIGERIDQRVDAQLAQLFAEGLGLFSGVTTIAQLTEQREFRLMMRAGPDAWIRHRMDASTGIRLNRYRADAEGQPGELLETRTNFDPHNDPPAQSWYLAPSAVASGVGVDRQPRQRPDAA